MVIGAGVRYQKSRGLALRDSRLITVVTRVASSVSNDAKCCSGMRPHGKIAETS